MSSLTNSLLGKKPAVQEFTGVDGVPTVDGGGGAANLNLKPKSQLRPKDPRDKRKLKEEDDSIIPKDAEEVASTAGTTTPTEIGAAETGLTGQPGEREGGGESNPNLLTTELALVAPDCTPGWDKMTSPSALPKSEKRPVAEPAPETAAAPAQQAATNGPASALDAIKLSRPGAGKADQSLEHQARNLVSSVVQEDSPLAPVIPMTETELIGQGKPMPDHVQSNTAGNTLKRFNFAAK